MSRYTLFGTRGVQTGAQICNSCTQRVNINGVSSRVTCFNITFYDQGPGNPLGSWYLEDVKHINMIYEEAANVLLSGKVFSKKCS